jgi:hypothetical protein
MKVSLKLALPAVIGLVSSYKVRFSATSAVKFLRPSLGSPYGRYPELSETFALRGVIPTEAQRSGGICCLSG